MNNRFSIVLGVALVLSALPCRAQQQPKESEALKTLRESFHRKLLVASGSLNDHYNRALAVSESYYAAKGDYEQARALKARREDLAAIGLQAATAQEPVVNSIALSADNARTYGAVTARGGELNSWRTAACAAEWTLTKFVPGTYQLQFTYTMTPKQTTVSINGKLPPDPLTTLSYVVKENSLLGAGNKNECPIKLATAADRTPFTSEGTLQLTKPPFVVRLASLQSHPSNVLMISDVKLVQVVSTTKPVTAAPTATAAPAFNPRDALAKLIASLPDAIAKARQPVVDEYTAKLDALAAASPKDESLADAVDGEKRKLKKALTSPLTKSNSALDAFDEIEDVHFIPDPTNTGDTFNVQTRDGTKMRITLALVTCPPNDPASKDMETITKRFGISVAAAQALATDAQSFTAEYLQGRTLNLLVKHGRKSKEIPDALVFVENIGLYQSILIDHGLAVVDAPANKPAGREGEFITMLRDRESQARKQTPKPGGWGLSSAKP